MAQPRMSEDIIAAATASCAHEFITNFTQVSTVSYHTTDTDFLYIIDIIFMKVVYMLVFA